MTNTDTQKSHHLCPHCFKNPPPDADAAQQGEMRCFKCTHNCPLASVKESPVRPCAKCGQPVRPSRCAPAVAAVSPRRRVFAPKRVWYMYRWC